uniref:Uncharacterized protein n=1 Tax=Faecalibaculum rodentium TaxID=1702221 RepID=A0A140DWH1_9FIRM|nr:hypothetical protein AALO17_18640 [Faecalibaculum rodentium]
MYTAFRQAGSRLLSVPAGIIYPPFQSVRPLTDWMGGLG